MSDVTALPGDTLIVGLNISPIETGIKVDQVDVERVTNIIAKHLVDNFSWMPSIDEVKEIMTIREKRIHDVLVENISLRGEIDFLEKKADILSKMEVLLQSYYDENDDG